jgi:deoxyhypusine synthase
MQFLESLPDILKARELRAVVEAIVAANQRQKPVVIGIGGHIIKCGLSPLIIQLMTEGIISGIAMNGGASIHDFELALIGRTSEDVAASLESGMFGMVRETGESMNHAIKLGSERSLGLGESLGMRLIEIAPPFLEYSILAAGKKLGIPVTVHTAIGGDTIHMHPGADGSALGHTSFIDFRLLTSILMDFDSGGVYLNLGSAVILPEVFLKALNLARNLSSHKIQSFTTVNMDMLQHYRPLQNVVQRPTQIEGHGYSITGHHEIMIPLLLHAVLAKLKANSL